MHSCKKFVLRVSVLRADIMINKLENKTNNYDIYIRIKAHSTCKYISEIFMTLDRIQLFIDIHDFLYKKLGDKTDVRNQKYMDKQIWFLTTN